LHLAEPWRVVLAGEANVGKSSLLNDLLGYDRAIVFDEPGTTRDVVSASTAIDGLPVLLSDTAGLRAPSDDIEAAGIALTNQLMAQADVVLLVVEGEQLLRDTKLTLNKLREWQHYHVASGATIVVISKCDVLTDEAINRAMYHVEQSTPWPVVPISVLEDWGTDELLACMASELVPALPPAESGIPFTPLQCETINAALECLTRSANGEATSVLQQLLSLGTRDSSPPADSADCTNSSD
jgi:tRNA modification GTPase